MANGWRFAMAAAIALRDDLDAATLRLLARRTGAAGQGRRLLALAEIYDGGSRGKAARIGGVGLQTVRDWVLRFNAAGPDGLVDGKAPGKPAKLGGGAAHGAGGARRRGRTGLSMARRPGSRRSSVTRSDRRWRGLSRADRSRLFTVSFAGD